MKKMILLLALISLPAWAAPGHWRTIKRVHENASNPMEFRILQKSHPDLFGTYDPETVLNASYQSMTYFYNGNTLCSPEDLRRVLKMEGHSICLVGEGGRPGRCERIPPATPANNDPCEE